MIRIPNTAVAGMLALGLCLTAATSDAQTKKPATVKKTTAKTPAAGATSGFKKINGIKYKIVRDIPGKNAQTGDIVEFNILAKTDTTTLADSRQKDGKPAVIRVEEVKNKGQWQAALPMMSAGDSAVIEISCDTLLADVPKEHRSELPPWFKKGKKINVYLSVVSVKSMEDFQKEMDAKAAEQGQADDKTLQDYFAKNGIKAKKTPSGLYYTVEKEGVGPNIAAGQTVTMNYTGKILNGDTFDSNVDSNFHHVQPFDFVPGSGSVIKGWEEGILLFNKGSKATLYIPSPLGYGAQSPSPLLPANSILVFNIEAVDVKAASDNAAPAIAPGK